MGCVRHKKPNLEIKNYILLYGLHQWNIFHKRPTDIEIDYRSPKGLLQWVTIYLLTYLSGSNAYYQFFFKEYNKSIFQNGSYQLNERLYQRRMKKTSLLSLLYLYIHLLFIICSSLKNLNSKKMLKYELVEWT